MNRKTIVASLSEIANELDNTGLHNEANEITQIMVKVSQAKQPWSWNEDDEKESNPALANQALYNVMKRMTGRSDYNKMDGKKLNSFIVENYQALRSAVKAEAEKLGANVGEALQRLDKAEEMTSDTFAMPIRNKQPGVGVPPSTVSSDQSTDDYDPAAEDYNSQTLPIFENAKNWIKKFGGKGHNEAKAEATRQYRANKMSIRKYNAILELLINPNATPARKVPMGPFRGNPK